LEKNNSLPKGWSLTTLDDISLKLKAGGTPSTQNKNYYKNGIIPFVKIDDISNEGKYLDSTKISITDEGLKNSAAWIIPENSILYSMYASYGIPIINRLTVSTSQAIIAYVPPSLNLMCLDYVYYFLQSIKSKLIPKGTTQKNLNAKIIRDLSIKLSPINEQKRIAKKIDELFLLVDSGKQQLQLAKTKLKFYRNSLLTFAFSGNLTNSWRKQHPNSSADSLLKSIEFERKKENKKQVSYEPRENLTSIPENWIWVNIENIEKFIGSGITPRGGKSNYFDSGIPFIRSQNVYPDGLRLKDIVYVSDEQHSKMSRTHIQNYDVLLNLTGASIGRSTYVPEGFGEGNVNQHVCIIRLYSGISSNYVSHWLNSPKGQQQIFSSQKGQTREGLNYSQIRSILIPLCSFDEQNEVINNLEINLSKIFSIGDIIEKRYDELDHLQTSILKQAFEGKLIPQDSNDESAEILLKKIKQEKLSQN